ncbi:MAG: hypothetical protein PHG66_01135 [Candidatus Colwellbacteria bacterium]|nr:hypothetical protein [Candidatus Colwellbacteria bacterium]
MSESEVSSLNNLSEYLISKKFEITNQYSVGGLCVFLRVMSEDTGDDFLLAIGKSHNIRGYEGIELVPFTDTDRVVVKMDSRNSYGEINSEGIEEDLYLDPTEVDRMMDQYQAIDLDAEKADVLRENISGYKSQLERLKFCTNNIKYKLSVVSSSAVCYINRANTVECFAVRRSSPKLDEDKNLCIVIDLETFIDSPDSITSDIKRVTKNLHTILGTAHEKQTSAISLRLKQIQTATGPLIEKYNKKEKYLKSIDKLTIVVVKIRKQERELLIRIKRLKKESSSTSITDTETKAFALKKIEDEYTKIMKFKKESVDLLSEIKLEYNNFILNFDYALFDTLRLLNGITLNLTRIGVIKCKKEK